MKAKDEISSETEECIARINESIMFHEGCIEALEGKNTENLRKIEKHRNCITRLKQKRENIMRPKLNMRSAMRLVREANISPTELLSKLGLGEPYVIEIGGGENA